MKPGTGSAVSSWDMVVPLIEIQVKVYGLFSDVKVTDQPGEP
jgi:hypothetical protein